MAFVARFCHGWLFERLTGGWFGTFLIACSGVLLSQYDQQTFVGFPPRKAALLHPLGHSKSTPNFKGCCGNDITDPDSCLDS